MSRINLTLINLIGPLVFLAVVAVAFSYLQFSFMQPTEVATVVSQYPTDQVLKNMASDGVYAQASSLVVPTADGTVTITTPAQSPSSESSDFGKVDLSQFNQ